MTMKEDTATALRICNEMIENHLQQIVTLKALKIAILAQNDVELRRHLREQEKSSPTGKDGPQK